MEVDGGKTDPIISINMFLKLPDMLVISEGSETIRMNLFYSIPKLAAGKFAELLAEEKMLKQV